MSELDSTTEVWVLRAKVAAYETALAQAANELHAIRDGVRGFALTLRKWAVAAGGHTPSAIVASRMLELIGDEKAPATSGEAVPPDHVTAEGVTDEQIRELLASVSTSLPVLEVHAGKSIAIWCRAALGEVHLHGSTTHAARARIAEILNARSGK